MWLSGQLTAQSRKTQEESGADLGVTTISGDQVSVLARGEIRQLPVYGPGGYLWKPENGDRVLLIRGGSGGEELCVAGGKQKESTEQMECGEVCLFSRDSRIYLKNDGTIELQGSNIRLQAEHVEIEGTLTENGEAIL